VSFVCALIVVIYAATNDFEANTRYSLVFMGTMKDPNYMSAFIIPGFCLALIHLIYAERYRMIYAALAGVIAFAVLLSGSRAGYITVVFLTGIIVIAYMRNMNISGKKILFFLLVLCVITAGVISIQSSRNFARLTDYESYVENIRFQIWSIALELYNESKYIGSGLGAASDYTLQIIGIYPHNNFLVILIDQGLMGIILFVLFFLNMMSISKHNRKYIFFLLVSFFVPLFFVDGYQTATFWLPMVFCQIVSDFCKRDAAIFYDLY
jgi:O-antigen ligase